MQSSIPNERMTSSQSNSALGDSIARMFPLWRFVARSSGRTRTRLSDEEKGE